MVLVTVYAITHNASGRQYIGITKKSAAKRWAQHWADARHGRTNSPLHRALAKHGKEAFVFEVLERHEDDAEACRRERELIADRGTISPAGFNLADGGRVRFSVSMETRERIAEKLRGREVSDETRARISQVKRGRPMPPRSEETREKLRLAATGKTHGPEARAKIIAANTGRIHDALARAKMSAAGSGRPKSPEHNAAVSAAKKGWNPSPETRARMAEAQRRRWARARGEVEV